MKDKKLSINLLSKAAISILCLMLSNSILAERIKDLISISGIRSNQLVGYGLVVGLDGTGDSNDFTNQTFKTMLANFGIEIPPGVSPKSKNVAAVVVHADLEAFAKPGMRVDVTVSSIGSAKSLRGGTLLLTPLKGANGEVYAVAQGNLVVGGFGAEGKDGSKIKVNIPVVGRVPNGGTIERESPSSFARVDNIKLLLNRSDFTTARRIADGINNHMGQGTASPIDASSVYVNVPLDKSQRVRFISIVENINITPGEEAAKIIVNSRTGTIVIGKNVTVSQAAVTHGSLTVTISEDEQVSQPNPASDGKTVTSPKTSVEVTRDDSKMFLINKGVSLDDIVRAVNLVGASPGDLMAILEALKQSGSLSAQLEII